MKKSGSNQLSLATDSILGQAPSQLQRLAGADMKI